MILWALLVGITIQSAMGKVDAGANVEAVFATEAQCKAVKEQLDKSSAEAFKKGEVNPDINSFGSSCVKVNLDQHQKPKVKGA